MIAIVSVAHGAGHGAEVVFGELLRAWREPALDLTVLAPPGSSAADAAASAGARVVPLPSHRDGLASNLIAGSAAARQLGGCRLVHAWTARALEVSWLVGRRLGVPATATIHDHPDSSAESFLRRRLWRAAANLQRAVVFPSAALERAWRDAGFSRPSRVIHNGAGRLGLPARERETSRVVIGFLGMYAPWKGFEVARAWALAEWPDSVRWAFFGGVHETLEAPAAALAAALGPRVAFRGAQPRERIFAEVDVLVHCSTAFDPFPTVLLEAAHAGVPVVASSLGGANEIVEHGRTGFLFDPGSPDEGLALVRQLVADAGLRARIGSAARERSDRDFHPARMAADYAEFWRTVSGGTLSAAC